jgi:glutamine---fructose-6-phosphate transaminase (isomerizing)
MTAVSADERDGAQVRSAIARPLMLDEAAEAPAVVAGLLTANEPVVRDLGDRLRARPPRFVVTAGRGSSGHAAAFGKYLIETRLGLVTAAAAPSVATLYPAELRLREALFVVISQSGRSPDLVRQAEAARRGGALTLALVNDPAPPLAAAADLVVPLHAGPEHSVAATKSCLASFAALLHLVARWRDDAGLLAALDRLPERLKEGAATDWSAAAAPLAEATDAYVVGRGLGLPVAQEAALKLKEAAALHAEAFSGAELLHGPVALVGDGYPVLLLAQPDETLPEMRRLAGDLRSKGARLLLTAPIDKADDRDRLPLPPPLHPACDPLAMLQAFYPLAAQVAVARGCDPDRPRNLRKVTETR